MTFDAESVLIGVFLKLRRGGFTLGISELLDCMAEVRRGWDGNEEELKRTVRLLWCNSIAEIVQFNEAWSALASPEDVAPENYCYSPRGPVSDAAPSGEQLPPRMEPTKVAIRESETEKLLPLPIITPFRAIARSAVSAPDSYWPVSRRFMSYIWRYLRWPISDGPQDVLNVDATVQNAARRGFYFSPVFKRRTRNNAHLVLLVDRGGSMVPFHRLVGGLVETAQEESDLGRVEVFYFHNVVGDYLYTDSFLTEPIALDHAFDECRNNTSVMLVSDCGAARGQRRTTRIRLTAELLFQLRARTQLIAWLNPLPENRWLQTSAEIVSHFVPMFQMDEDGLSNAIDVLRGQPVFPRFAK